MSVGEVKTEIQLYMLSINISSIQLDLGGVLFKKDIKKKTMYAIFKVYYTSRARPYSCHYNEFKFL